MSNEKVDILIKIFLIILFLLTLLNIGIILSINSLSETISLNTIKNSNNASNLVQVITQLNRGLNWQFLNSNLTISTEYDGNRWGYPFGSFHPGVGIIIVNNESNKSMCLTFLHEMGHKISYDKGVFNDLNNDEKESIAEKFKQENESFCGLFD